MSKKPLLKASRQEFADWLMLQDDKLWYDLATTPLNANTEAARFRRLYLKFINDRNLRKLKS